MKSLQVAAEAGEPPDRDYIAGLGKGLAVIECFGEHRPRLTIAEAASLTRMSRAAARRCLLTLHRLGYAGFDGKFFTLTPRILRLGYAYLAASELPQVLTPVLERLSEETQESCSASILDGDEIIYVARAPKRRIMTVDLNVGSRLPAYCTSMGRVLLAALPPEEARARLAAAQRRRLTPNTRTGLDELMSVLDEVRRQGYCVTDQELEVGLVSIAVPALDSADRTVAAINTSAQSARVPAAQMVERFLGRLRAAQASLRPSLKGKGSLATPPPPAAAGPSPPGRRNT